MNNQIIKFGALLLLACCLSFFSCKPKSFSEEDAMKLQSELELTRLKQQDSLNMSKNRITFILSLVDAVKTTGLKSTGSATGVSGVSVTLGQNGTLISKTSDAAGMILFSNLQRGRATLHVTLANYSEINAVLDFDKAGPDSTAGGRQVGLVLPMILLTGANTGTLRGTVTFEGDLTNKTQEPAPSGTKVIATVDPGSAALNQIVTDIIVSINYDNLSLETTTDANGNYSFTVPGTSQGLSYAIKVSDFTYNQNLLMLTKNGVSVTGVQSVPTNFGSSFSAGSSAIPTVSPVVVTIGAPDYSFTAAVASATVTAGVVTGIAVTTQGDNYINGKVLVVIPSPGVPYGTTATATATVTAGKITAITVTNGGSNYSSTPTVSIVNQVEKIQAKATATVGSDGNITNLSLVVNGNSGYVTTPSVTIAPAVSSVGSGATAVANIANGSVTSLTLLTGGSGYTGVNSPATAVNAPASSSATMKGTGTTILNIYLGTGARSIVN
jgi:hypothetical protein